MMKTAIIGTWTFSFEAVKQACQVIKETRSSNRDISIEAVEKGINVIEGDVSYGEYYVGKGGVRNKNGELELDAAIMSGKHLEYGAVTALQGLQHPISVARKVMEISPHSILTGSGAQSFAVKQGFLLEKELLEKKTSTAITGGHDTLGVICSVNEDITVGVSTSGIGGKEAGRVGDSALPGSGLYADKEGGAACCSGDGDEILKHCPAYRVVEYMKRGKVAQEACNNVISEISRRSDKEIELVIIALDTEGNFGTGSTLSEWIDPKTKEQIPGFPYVVWLEHMVEPEIRIHKIIS